MILHEITEEEALRQNQACYRDFYSQGEWVLEYPADWVIRFYHMYLKKIFPTGRVFDHGCGCGNNSAFFFKKGYEVYGIDVTEEVLPWIRKSLSDHQLDPTLNGNFSIVSPDCEQFDFGDNFFDFILSNQVLYLIPSREKIKRICQEFVRILKPGGIVFISTVGLKNGLVQEHTVRCNGMIHEIRVEDPSDRFHGYHQFQYVVRDEEELKELFSDFECLSVGYLDLRMCELTSGFHWIFIGRNKK